MSLLYKREIKKQYYSYDLKSISLKKIHIVKRIIISSKLNFQKKNHEKFVPEMEINRPI